MLTLVTTCRPFEGEFRAIQDNALRSWVSWPEPPDVIVFGDEPGVKSCCERLGVQHAPHVERTPSGVPRLDDLFARADRMAATEVVAYANADILLLPDALTAIEAVHRSLERYLLIARRWNVRFPRGRSLSGDQLLRLRDHAREHGALEPAYGGTDLFAWPRGAWGPLPPLAIGRGRWDSALIHEARSRCWPVVDATAALTAVHQDHADSSCPDADARRLVALDELANERLLGGATFIFTSLDATHVLDSGRLRAKRVLNPLLALRRLGTLPARSPRWRALAPVVDRLAPLWRALRRAPSRRSR